MEQKILDYAIEREREPRCYCIKINYNGEMRNYSAFVNGSILIKSGKIVSINGNGRWREDFRALNMKIYPNRLFYLRQENEVLEGLEEMICL